MRPLLLLITLFSTLKAHYLREWAEYHKMIGVDHFRLYNNASEDHFEQAPAPYIASGLVEVIDWRGDAEPEKAYNFILDQIKAYQHALTHKSSRAALIDIDEFIVPMRDFSLKTCLNKHFQNADAIHVNWSNFGTSHVTIPKGENILPQLKKCSRRHHMRNFVGKTIIRPESGDIQKMRYAHHLPLYPGKTFVDGHKNPIDFVDNDLRPQENT